MPTRKTSPNSPVGDRLALVACLFTLLAAVRLIAAPSSDLPQARVQILAEGVPAAPGEARAEMLAPFSRIDPEPFTARSCSTAEIAALTAPDNGASPPYRLVCFATLPTGAAVQQRVLLEGAEASGAGIDCNGGTIGRQGHTGTVTNPTVAVWSRHEGDEWSVPRDVRITGCTIHGNLRVWGLGLDDVDGLRLSSRMADHTARAQAAGPKGLTLENVTLVATGSIPLYVGPGVTGFRMMGGGFRGRSDSTAVYMDAESAGAVIQGVDFDVVTGREQIAVDGSADNRIVDNVFRLRSRGGVFLYRNCGENGVIRHQTPSNNVITGNRFEQAALFRGRAIVLGSREGRRRYCGDDAGWPFGSSIDNRDHATGNVVARNSVSTL